MSLADLGLNSTRSGEHKNSDTGAKFVFLRIENLQPARKRWKLKSSV